MRNTETHQILVRKRCFPVCAEGRGRSAEAREGLAEAHERVRKSLHSLRSPFAEADPKIQPKNLRGSSRGRRKQKRLQALLAEGSLKGFAEGVVSVMKLYKNKNHRSIGLLTIFLQK